MTCHGVQVIDTLSYDDQLSCMTKDVMSRKHVRAVHAHRHICFFIYFLSLFIVPCMVINLVLIVTFDCYKASGINPAFNCVMHDTLGKEH